MYGENQVEDSKRGENMKYLTTLLFGMLMLGCANNNQITIENKAQASIMFNFRSKLYTLKGNGGDTVIKDIPNGDFTYSTTYTIPPGATKYSISNEAAGVLNFKYEESQYLLNYASIMDDSGSYSVNVTISGTNSQSSNVTSP